MNDKIEKTVQEYRKYGCSGTIMMNYRKYVNLSEEEAITIAKPYLRGAKKTCGAILAAHEILKRKAPNKIKELDEKYQKKNNSTICKELKGLTGGHMLRTCPGCVEDVCIFLNEALEESD